MEEVVTLNRKEQWRIAVLNQIERGALTAAAAAAILGVTVRQVRRLLVQAGIASPRKRRAPRHRSRRERYPQEGMLLQIDGSRHDWLEGRGPYLTLIGAIDDATGQVSFGLFREQEDAQGYFLLF